MFAVGAEEVLAHPDAVMDGPTRWAFVGGLILFLAAESAMVARLTGSLARERFVLIGSLGIGGLVLGGLNAAALASVVLVMMVVALGVETARYREPLSQLR